MMNLLQEFSAPFVNWSLGLTVLIGLSASHYSGVSTVLALPIAATSITLSALCGPSVQSTAASYKKRKFYDFLDFLTIWMEILEILTCVATCARIASASLDYISRGRMRDWFLGLESHSLGEPWPDVLGVTIVIVIMVLFMLGLEKSPSFSVLLLFFLAATFVFFVSMGGTLTVIEFSKWWEGGRTASAESVLAAATLCSYGFVNTFPHMVRHKALKISTMVVVPLVFYTSTVIVLTLMSHYKELTGTATPFLRVFEIRDVDWARLVMAVCIICVVCLALPETLPCLFGLFVTLASKKWNIFLTSLQYRNSLTGAPMLAIFAAGSLAAILAFACPLNYLVKILNTSTLLKCVVRSLQVLYYQYKPEFETTYSGVLASSSTMNQYSQLKQSSRTSKETTTTFKAKVANGLPWWRKKLLNPTTANPKYKEGNSSSAQDNEYLLLDDYCDKPVDLVSNGDSSEETDVEQESVLSSDLEDSHSSTDVDVAVQEYKDKLKVATIDNFNENRRPTLMTAIAVAIFLIIVAVSSVTMAQTIIWKLYSLTIPCSIVIIFSIIVILVLPRNCVNAEKELLPKPLVPLCAILSTGSNMILVRTIIEDVWPGFIFWFLAGCLLFWRCDCCTCEGLLSSHKNNLNITENISEYASKFSNSITAVR